MKGYVKNKTHLWRHAMKRSIGPGQQVPLDELFEQYGKKYDIEPGKPFVDWLSGVKLRDAKSWEVVYEEDQTEVVEQAEVKAAEEPVEKPVKVINVNEEDKVRRRRYKELTKEMTSADVRPFVKKELGVKDVVGFSVREARAELKKITDINLLKHALSEARQLAGKDSLAILLRRRVQELELTRR